MPAFKLQSTYSPQGDQPRAIEELVRGLEEGRQHQTLLGITGSGKSFTIANVIQQVQRPALVMAPNKILAAQLYSELREFFPENAVEYFVSFYDYYQPEAYVPTTDTYIEKDSAINDTIDRLRHSATRSLLDRDDVIVVASVSCIYGIGDASVYSGMLVQLEVGMTMERDTLLQRLVGVQYERNDYDFHRGTFRCRGDVVEIFPAYEDSLALRIEFFGDEIEAISEIDPLRGRSQQTLRKVTIYPATHYVVAPERKLSAIEAIKAELKERLLDLRAEGKLLEAQRLEQRTQFDIEMMITMGYCNGIENYSRHLSGREPGEAPPCLLDYFPEGWVLVADESHLTIPQIGAMYRGDRARKETLVGYGFRLPSALDNRPLKFEEFEERALQRIYVSATPGPYELDRCEGVVTEQIIRPTGLLDPTIEVRPALEQVDDVYAEIRIRAERNNERVMVTTLTKRMAEDLTEYLRELGIKVRYLHSDIDTMERIAIIRDLRLGVFQVLVGINLLREGLDIPEVTLVAILDADKEGFLRSERSLVQTVGRAARNASGHVIMYADKITPSMEACIRETARRRALQEAHNLAEGITPQTIRKAVKDLQAEFEGRVADDPAAAQAATPSVPLEVLADPAQLGALLQQLTADMKAAAKALKFEDAAAIRDRIKALEQQALAL